METLSTLKFAARAKRIRCNILQKEAGVNYTAAAVESMAREVALLRKRVAELENMACKCSRVRTEASSRTPSFYGQSVDSVVSTGDDTLSGSDFSPSCASRGMEEAVETKDDVQACTDLGKRELVEGTGKLAEVETRIHVAAHAAKDTPNLAVGGAAVRGRSCSPSFVGSATSCDPFNGVNRQVLNRSGHAVSMCQLTSAFVSQSPAPVSRCCSPLLVSRQRLAHTPYVISAWRVSPRAQSPPRYRSLSPCCPVFVEAPTQPSMRGRPRLSAFSPLAAPPSTQRSRGAVGSTQRWAHI